MQIGYDDAEAIFETAGQAVHVAFLVMSQEAQQDAPLRMGLIRMMEAIDLPSSRHRAWLDQLRGTKSGTINFAGLSGNDVRAQCSMIVQAVRDRLPEPEMWLMHAKYGVTDFEDVEGRRRFAFSAERIAGIKGLAEWIAPSFPAINPVAMDCLVARLFANHKKLAISVRDLARSFGGNHMTYARASDKIKAQLKQLEAVALSRLEPIFHEHGLIKDFETF